MEAKRGVVLLAAAFVVSPLALGLGIVLLIAASDDDGGGGGDFELSAGTLRVGPGYVPAKYAALIEKAAADCDQGLPAGILAAQLQAESNFNPNAQSKDPKTGKPIADGIAQFIPSTWASSGIDGNGDGKKNVWDPEDAIPSQGKMMCELLKTAKKHPGYNGSPIELALAGYNAGWGRVDQFKGVPPASFAAGQTYNYVKSIMAAQAKLTAPDTSGAPEMSGEWTKPVNAPLGTPYHQSGGMWSSGYHTGIDFAAPIGTPIRAAGPGKVVSASRVNAYGRQVIIRHADGMYTQYAHMSELKVSAGDTVKGGQIIGLSGADGNVSGPHLHFEVRTSPDYGTDISPLPYLRKKGVNI
ncbi:peptidoglycan DD-metalloendopeptidase family protein [Streptomyces sp. VN1]|uniref:peptidoglycan DD-metalloendopeptidase family protein n=1 Tax=Streptomyces sp. VN1 TaxID=1821625 RepID=UPI001413A4C7|nr:peptidoglycan DD-metalloendopeptidase family protein [Streptomyces sp. VN1]QIP74693.1 peptidase M23 [Streptomyces sp. VN1]